MQPWNWSVVALAAFIATSPLTQSQPAQPSAAGKTSAAQGEANGEKSARPPKRQRGPGQHYGVQQAPPKAKGAVRLASYNLQNLFDHVDDPSLSGEWEDLKLAVTDDRAKALAEVIRRLDADILCLEEIESKEALTWFRDTYLKGLGYDHIESIDAGYYRGVEQSVLSRFPISAPMVFVGTVLETRGGGGKPEGKSEGKSEGKQEGDKTDAKSDAKEKSSVPDDPTKFQRSPIAFDVQLPGGYSLTAFVIHHKAGGEKFNDHREAEAAKIIEFVKQRLEKNPNANIVVVGDFNATPMSDVRRMYKDAGLLNGYDFRSADDQAAGRNRGISEAQKQQLYDRYTTHESGRSIDYILLSSGFADEIVPGSFFVLSSLHPGDSYDWRKDTPPSGYASDHYPVALDFIPSEGAAKTNSSGDSRSNAPKSRRSY